MALHPEISVPLLRIAATFAMALLSWPISIATSWWTGHLIGERRRFGAWIAISSIGLGVLNALSIRGVQATTPLVFAGIGLAAIASIWRELE